MADSVADYLRSLNTSDRVRAAAWDAAYAPDDADAQQRLAQLPFNNKVRADLWDLRGGGGVENAGALQPASPDQFTDTPTPPEGSAMGRLVGNAWNVVNPLSLAKGLLNTVIHPQESAFAGVQAAQRESGKADEASALGHTTEAMGHRVASVLPLVGPAAASAGEQIASGDVAGGIGKGIGLSAPAFIPAGVRTATRAARVLPNALADSADAAAASRVSDVMSPKVGANKVRFGNQAGKIAPALAKDLAADGAPLSREGFHAQISSKLADAERALDDASTARNAKLVYHTKPIISALRVKVNALTAPTVRSGRVTAGADVIPSPNAARVAPLQQAISELEDLGPVASYESIRRIRQAYDGPAKAVYSSAMTADYMKAQGSKLGAADVTGVLREKLAAMDPKTAAANADYHLYKTADDVMQATAEVERTRPKVGRAIVARLTATMGGGTVAGAPGAVAGFVLGPAVESALSMGLTSKLKTAATLTKLATAIRGGNVTYANSLAGQLRRLGLTSANAARNTTSPSESRSRTTTPVLSTP